MITVIHGDFRDVHTQFPAVDVTYSAPPWDLDELNRYRAFAGLGSGASKYGSAQQMKAAQPEDLP